MIQDYESYDGIGLSELVAKKEVTLNELISSAIARIEELNPKLNAVIHKMYEDAQMSVGKINHNAPFVGVPFLLKDISQAVQGEKLTQGSKLFQTYRASQDSEYVVRMRKTGVVFLGQTNVPEFALMGITEPKFYGPTRNPWNTDYTPGGSSGGSAAAVASGMVPIAGANDGGGSIRIPAAYCGLFGLKPTRGRTPVGPQYGRAWQGASVEHVLTKTVRDSAYMLDLLKGPEKGGAFSVPNDRSSYLSQLDKPLSKEVKIAFSVKSPLGTEVHPECRQAVVKTAKFLEELGFIVEEKEAPVDGIKLANSYFTMYFGEVAATLANAEKIIGRKVKMEDVEPTTWVLGMIGKVTNAAEFVLSMQEWDVAAYKMEMFHETYDFYMTPTTAFPPAKIGELDQSKMESFFIQLAGKLHLGKPLKKMGIVEQIAKKSLMRTPFTQLANLTGQPAMSVPLHLTADGLPCGVQFMAARGREDLLFQLAAMLEKSPIWIDLHRFMN